MSTEQETKDIYWDYYSDVDINKEYTCVSGKNNLVGEETYETYKDGKRLKQTYTDDEGYTFTCYQKGNKITCITINKPQGNQDSEVIITSAQMEIDGFSRSQRKKVLQSLPEQVVQGASLKEIYQNFHDYTGSSFPEEEMSKDEYLLAQQSRSADPVVDDYSYYLYTEEERQAVARDMALASRTSQLQEKVIAQKLGNKTLPTEEELKSEVEKNPVIAMTNNKDTGYDR